VRIAYVSDAVWPYNTGGKERRIREISKRLAAAGHEVHVYTMKWWDGPASVEVEGVHLHAIMKRRPLYHGDRRSMLEALLFGLATLKLLFVPFDVIDVDHMPFFPLFSARLVCALRGKRMTATWHEVWGGDYWKTYLGRLALMGTLVERVASRMPHQIIAVSDQTAGRLRSELDAAQPISTIANGIDFGCIDRTPPSVLAPDVLFAGRLLANKNVDQLVRAVARLVESRPALRCLVIGQGPERQALQALVTELAVTDHVTFSDFLPGDDIYGVMKSAGVFVLPSVREGFGAVILEANACGLPTITVEHPDNAARHLIIEGRNGFVVALDPDCIAAAIARVLDGRDAMEPRQLLESRGEWVDWSVVSERVLAVLRGDQASTPGAVVPA
jgi:glycosyltransferase involved in cell wall biosynthesis